MPPLNYWLRTPRLQSVVLALLSLLAILGWQELVVRHHYQGQQTALFFTGEKFRTPPAFREGTYLFRDSFGYDAQFYRYVAHDPFFRQGLADYIDDARHRYGRIAVPILAWALSGGSPVRIDRYYQFTVAAFLALGVYWSCLWMTQAGLAPLWGALVFLALPASLASVDRLVVDGPLCALFAGYLYYSAAGNRKAVYAIALVAPLVRETGLLIAAGVAGEGLWKRRWGLLVAGALCAIPFVLWNGWVSLHTPPSMAPSIVQNPVIGLLAQFFHIWGDRETSSTAPAFALAIHSLRLLALLGFILTLAIAARWLWKAAEERGGAVWISLTCFLVLGLVLGHRGHLAEAFGYARPVSPLILWLMLQAVVVRAWWALAPPLLVSAGVGVHFLSPGLSVLQAFGITVLRR
jgi:hypothetical protein